MENEIPQYAIASLLISLTDDHNGTSSSEFVCPGLYVLCFLYWSTIDWWSRWMWYSWKIPDVDAEKWLMCTWRGVLAVEELFLKRIIKFSLQCPRQKWIFYTNILFLIHYMKMKSLWFIHYFVSADTHWSMEALAPPHLINKNQQETGNRLFLHLNCKHNS